MSQVTKRTRVQRLADSVLPGRTVGGYANLIEARLRKLAAAGSTRALPMSGHGDGAIFFRAGQLVYAESTRTPTPARRTVGLAALGLVPTDASPAPAGAGGHRGLARRPLRVAGPAELPGIRAVVGTARPHR
jgi:hypothetical protein